MQASNIRPLNGRIFIKVLDEVEEYKGAIELAPTGQEKSNIALVERLPVNYVSANPLKVGDKVIFNRHSGSVLNFDKFAKNAPEYRLIKEEDILCLIDVSST